MARPDDRPGDRLLWTMLAATALCYAIGYPLALIGKSSIGWGFVSLGGGFLVAVVWLFIRRVHT
jgi:hypothetical protein